MVKKLTLPKGTIVPDHIAVISDGNGRWARSKGLLEIKGHEAGARALREILDVAKSLGVHTLTVWGWSTENWNRPAPERQRVFAIIKKTIETELATAHKEKIRFVHIGRKDRLPRGLVDFIKQVEVETKSYNNHVLNVGIDYGGQEEIIQAVRSIIRDKIKPETVDEKLFGSYLYTADQPYPYPDLVIRTSGEQRTSGYLLWQAAYAEFYWEQDHLPDMTPEHLKKAILDYSRRRRRFGAKDIARHLEFKPELTAKLELDWWRLAKVPEGTRFRDFVIAYLAEQYGISKKHATSAAKYLIWALASGDKKNWRMATRHLKSFYKLIRDHIKLAFEPEIVASLKVKFWQNPEDEIARQLYAEEYRISDFQAAKAAHLRVLAQKERNLALETGSETHWRRAEDYLARHYRALKDRVA